MKQTLEKTKERLWKIKDDEDFEQKSQRIIEETIKDMKNDIGLRAVQMNGHIHIKKYLPYQNSRLINYHRTLNESITRH